MTSLTGLADREAAEVAAQFGVALEQVRRDHLISLILAALTPVGDELIFFGGTALARTHLPAGRLSEDIDLLTTSGRESTADEVTRAIGRALLPTYGRVTWGPELNAVRRSEAGVLSTASGLNLRLQLLDAADYSPWPTEVRDLEQRYGDVPPARLRVPTRSAFAAWKTATWHDRAAARDLFDLYALAAIGAINAEAAVLFATHGPTTAPPRDWMFATPPSDQEWHGQLASQTNLEVSAHQALRVVRDAWRSATG